MPLVTGERCMSASGYRREMHECIWLQEREMQECIWLQEREMHECIWLHERAVRVYLITGEECESASGYRRGL